MKCASVIIYSIYKRLNKTFITPFDREDILILTQKLDDIGDMLLAASIRVDIFNVTEKIRHADKLAAIVLQQIKEHKLSELETSTLMNIQREVISVKKSLLRSLANLRLNAESAREFEFLPEF